MSAVELRSPSPRCVVSAWATLNLAAPVTHIWYFKGVPSRLGYLLDMAPKDLEKVIYFAAYMIITWTMKLATRRLPELEKELRQESKQSAQERDATLERLAWWNWKDLAALEEAKAPKLTRSVS